MNKKKDIMRTIRNNTESTPEKELVYAITKQAVIDYIDALDDLWLDSSNYSARALLWSANHYICNDLLLPGDEDYIGTMGRRILEHIRSVSGPEEIAKKRMKRLMRHKTDEQFMKKKRSQIELLREEKTKLMDVQIVRGSAQEYPFQKSRLVTHQEDYRQLAKIEQKLYDLSVSISQAEMRLADGELLVDGFPDGEYKEIINRCYIEGISTIPKEVKKLNIGDRTLRDRILRIAIEVTKEQVDIRCIEKKCLQVKGWDDGDKKKNEKKSLYNFRKK